MLKSIIETFPDADIDVAIVWINKLPADWMHQLTDKWADPDRLRTGDDLVRELAKSMKRLLGK